ncbi:MAG: alpha/beta fold hydrolase [Candidatus Binataceae bacterium]
MPTIKTASININYESFGEDDPLLLIMGFGMPGAAWAPMIPFLSGFRAIYFDNRGTGKSDKPDGPYTIPQMADDASNLLQALGIQKAKIYGISMGGMIAQELTLRHPGQVSKVVLGCTTAGGETGVRASEQTLQTLIDGAKLMATDPSGGLDMIMPLLFPLDFMTAHPELKQMMMLGLQMAPPTPSESIDRTLAGIMQFDAYDRLPQIKCPVLIVHGDRDILLPPANAEIIRKQIPQAELFIIPGAGHNYAAADPVGIHERIKAFLRG